jgi:hypothetical protein
MIKDNKRLLIITGLPHSGTTILTYILKQHPDILCYTDGNEGWILENDLLFSENSEEIEKILERNSDKIVLLKRPLVEVKKSNWMKNEMPNAKYIYCYKTFEDINLSWTKPTSFVPKLKDASEIERKIFYTDSWNAAMQFGENLQYFKKIFYNNFLKNPNSIINDLINWINLIAYDFDYSEVSSSKNIKNIISNTTAFPLATQIINKDIEVKISDCKKISFPEIKCENNLMI